jgi:hypothetical protein
MASRTGERGALARGAFTLAVLVSLAVLFAPTSDVPSSPPGVDKLVHLLLFATLAVTGRWAGGGRPALTVVLVLYATGSEVLQGLDMVGRSTSLGDWVADVLGVLLGMLGWAVLTRARPPGG